MFYTYYTEKKAKCKVVPNGHITKVTSISRLTSSSIITLQVTHIFLVCPIHTRTIDQCFCSNFLVMMIQDVELIYVFNLWNRSPALCQLRNQQNTWNYTQCYDKCGKAVLNFAWQYTTNTVPMSLCIMHYITSCTMSDQTSFKNAPKAIMSMHQPCLPSVLWSKTAWIIYQTRYEREPTFRAATVIRALVLAFVLLPGLFLLFLLLHLPSSLLVL